MEKNNVFLLDSYFDFLYAQDIFKQMNVVVKRNCVGCREGLLSQRDHPCLSETNKKLLDLYFEEILKLIDEEDIVHRWYQNVICLDISRELIELYQLKIKCKDWRAVEMKTPTWRRKIINMTVDIISLENRFV